jgi:tetratricopeptide (TPR) repeat protein/tRNA A-37 threonylcarbamoyl transferase component Bud32
MDIEPRVQHLLEEMLDSGHTPEEACRDCPELLPLVLKEWRRKLACDAHLDALFAASKPGDLSPAPPSAELPQIPGHELHEMLGRGGMGVVYKARHVRLNRTVAVKMLLNGAHGSPEARARFLREAEAVAGLRHPNIVQVYELGDQGGQPYFTMEFIEGGNLARKLAGTPQPPRHAASLLATLAEAVGAAHRSGIVHRDLKPSNVLLTADGTPKVSDFGLAKRMEGESSLTWTGTAVGTPSYMAPEQAEASPLAWGPAVDIYSLGAVLYELLTGRPPFRADTAAETIRQAISQDPVPPSRLNARVPRDVETICLKCLHKEPHLRYSGAAALAADLHHFLGGEAIAARPEGWLARLVRRVRRRPLLSAVVAGSILLAMTLAGGALWLISERTAVERAATTDLREMVRWQQQSSWTEAKAALERAKGRLGDRGSVELRRRLQLGERELRLVAQLDAIRLAPAASAGGVHDFGPSVRQYQSAFEEAGLGKVGDPPDAVARRINASSIKGALIGLLDDWVSHDEDSPQRSWAAEVARLADDEATGWHNQARDPATWRSKSKADEALANAPVADESVPFLLALAPRAATTGADPTRFLKRVQGAHPGDFWVNLALGEALSGKNAPDEAIRYYQAALAVRPGTAIVHYGLAVALWDLHRFEEAADQSRRAIALDPTSAASHARLAYCLESLGRHDEAVEAARLAVRYNPRLADHHSAVAYNLEASRRYVEAADAYRQALALDPKLTDSQEGLRISLIHQGKVDEARLLWTKWIEASPSGSDAWNGYSEFCLFLGQEDEYRRTCRTLLERFGATADPREAERIGRACLLAPCTAGEMMRASALIDRALADEKRHSPTWVLPYFYFAKALAEYRSGRLENTIYLMEGDASRVLGPAPRLVLAMALHRRGRKDDARKALASAIASFDWRPLKADNSHAWICHIFRREAERTILPGLSDFLAGKAKPQDLDERLALLGVCQFTNRNSVLGHLYTDAFAAAPQLAEDVKAGHRYHAACAAALAGSGHDENGGDLSQEERARWREIARSWLAEDLVAWTRNWDSGIVADRDLVRRTLTGWLVDPDFAGLREPGALDRLSDKERDEWRVLWKNVHTFIDRATNP